MSVQWTLASAIYPLECFREAVTAYQGLCSVKVISEMPGKYLIEIDRLADMIDERKLTHEFLNYLLDLSLEKHLAEFRESHGTDRVSATSIL